MSLYQRVIGWPLVFNQIRPLFVGGIDWTPLYDALGAGSESVVLDVGCGMGIAHQYLRCFREYHGFDTDSAAIAAARRKTAAPNVEYKCRSLSEDDLQRIRPTNVLMSGLLHHLSDAEAIKLLRMCGAAPNVERVVTADTVYIPGERLNNFLAFFDRGRFVRSTEDFLALAREAELQIVRCHPKNGRALYLIMTLSPRPRAACSPAEK